MSILTDEQKKELTNLKRKVTNNIKKNGFYVDSFDLKYYLDIKKHCEKKGYGIYTSLNACNNSLFAVYKLIEFDDDFKKKFKATLSEMMLTTDGSNNIIINPVFIPLVDEYMKEMYPTLKYKFAFMCNKMVSYCFNDNPYIYVRENTTSDNDILSGDQMLRLVLYYNLLIR